MSLVLTLGSPDHLIIQRLDAQEEEANEVESILQYGAKAIFDDKAAEDSAIRFTDQDIDSLLERTSGVVNASPKKEGAATFSQAKIWEANKGGALEDVAMEDDEDMIAGDGDFWSNMLVQQEETDRLLKQSTEANAGRGKRNRREVRPLPFLHSAVDLMIEAYVLYSAGGLHDRQSPQEQE